MDTSAGGDGRDQDRLAALEGRLEALEGRIGRVEARLVDVIAGAPTTPPPPVASPAAPARPSVPAPVTAAPTGWLAPSGRPAAAPRQRLRVEGAVCGRCERRLSPYWTRCQRCGASFATYPPILPGAKPAVAMSRPAAAEAEPAERAPEAIAAETTAPAWAEPAGPAVDVRAVGAFIERHTGRILAAIGGVAGILGVIYLLNVAFERNIVGPEGRVALGLVGGIVTLALGAWRMERGDRLLGTVLTPVGLAVVSIAAFAATQLYGLVGPEVGLAIAFASAVAAAVIAVRADSQLVAGFGLVAVLMAPPLLGASPDLVTLAFVGAALVGTTGIALWRTWRWLPPIAFVLAAPQLAFWLLGDPDPMWPALVAIGLFWLLNAIAAGGEEFRRRRNDLSPSSATLLLADAAFLVWGGFTLLDGAYEPGRGAFLLVVALAHLGLGGYFIVRDGERHLFGLMAMATGVAAVTMAVPIQAGGPAVPIAWTAEAAVLAWVAVVRRHPYSAIVSAILFGLAAAHLLLLEYPAGKVAADVPFVDGAGAALAFFVLGLAVATVVVPERPIRALALLLGVVVVTAACGVELAGPGLVVAWTVVGLIALVVSIGLPRLPERAVDWQLEGLIPKLIRPSAALGTAIAALAPTAGTALALGAATLHLVGAEYAPPPSPAAAGPFLDAAGLALAVYVAGLAAVVLLERERFVRDLVASTGLLVLAVAAYDQLAGVPLVAGWAALVVAGAALWRWLPVMPAGPATTGTDRRPHDARRGLDAADLLLPGATTIVAGILTAVVVTVELPLSAFGRSTLPSVPFTDAGAAAGAILAATSVIVGVIVGGPLARRVGVLVAGAVVAYTIPFEVPPWATAVLWAGLAVACAYGARRDTIVPTAFLDEGAVLLGAAAVVAVVFVAPPSRLVVGDAAISPETLVTSFLALGSVTAALVAFAVIHPRERWVRWLELAAGVAGIYTLSVAAVDAVATQVGGPTPVEELRWWGQLALSVLWTVGGVAAFVTGIIRDRPLARAAGLALLGIATVKVFLVDLSVLDIAFRAIALIAFAVLVLGSAWVWQHFRPHGPTAAPHAPAT
jgi:uncharacterized membrane protein